MFMKEMREKQKSDNQGVSDADIEKNAVETWRNLLDKQVYITTIRTVFI